MFRSTNIQVNVLPIFISFFRNQSLIVLWIHITQVICRRTSKTRHRIQFQWEYGFIVNLRNVYDSICLGIPSPFLSMSEWWFTCLRWLISLYFRQFQWQTFLRNHVRHVVLIIYREWFSPISLTRENSIAQTIVYFHTTQMMLFYIFLRSGNGFFYGQSIQRELR